ncbi:hypothetical protein N9P72_00100 [Amylibacter sp.]|nr:hypothetical protein [Amylibacter sp.]
MVTVNLDQLSQEQNQEFNTISEGIRTDYDSLIVTLSEEHLNNIHWIVGSIASRNKYYSPLFIRCCQIIFVKRLLGQSNPVAEILTGDRALATVLQKWCFEQNITETVVNCTESTKARVWRILRPARQYLIAIYLIALRCIGGSFRSNKILSDKPITLIDTFVLNNGGADEGSINGKVYKDRYYPGLMEQLTEEEKSNIFFLPTIVGFNNPIRAFRLIRSATSPFMIHDDYLKITDYFFALKHPFKLLRCSIKNSEFHGVNIMPLLYEEKFNHCSDFISILGILYHQFAYRLKESGIKVRLLVDWYENQVIDRGMIVGFHKHLPETKVVGYQGYVISKSLHLYVYPNLSEYKSKAVPDIVYVVGQGLKDDIHEFCDDINVAVGPAFRFNKLWRDRVYKSDPKIFTVLVGLPIGLEDCAHILKLIVNMLKNFNEENFQFWIKPHPTYGPESIKALLPGNWPKELIFKKGDFHDVIEESNLLVSNASSVSLEALAKGVPTIIVAPQNGIVQNPIPDKIPNNVWSVVYSGSELEGALIHFKEFATAHSDLFEQLSVDVKENYFNQVTRKNTLAFLEI